jgi:hypothetical protein
MRKLVFALVTLGLFVPSAFATQADPDQYKALGPPPVYGESNGWYYDATNDYLSGFINDVEVFYVTSAGAIVLDAGMTFGSDIVLENGAILENGTNNAVSLTENSEDLVLTFGTNDIAVTSTTGVTELDLGTINLETDEIDANGTSTLTILVNSEDMVFTGTSNLLTMSSGTSATFAFTPAVAFTGAIDANADVTMGGGASALTFDGGAGADTVEVEDNSATALGIGRNEAAGSLIVLDTTDSNEEVNVVGTTATSAFRVDTGFATFDEQAVLSAGADVNGDVTMSGGASALTFDGGAGADTVEIEDNSATALGIGRNQAAGSLIVIDTTDSNEEVNIVGTTAASAFRVDTGLAIFDEGVTVTGDLSLGGGAGSATFTDSASSIVVPDADSTALDVGAAGATTMLRFDTTDNAENIIVGYGWVKSTKTISASDTLDGSDCGKVLLVDAGIDTNIITLPATVAGCEFQFVYTGADGGALLDISPNASDAVHGSCTLAASVLELSGSDDADFGFTKATINTGDTVTIVGDGSVGWYVTACAGILANN